MEKDIHEEVFFNFIAVKVKCYNVIHFARKDSLE